MERTSRQTISFRHAFRLHPADELHSAGEYDIETTELLLDSVSFTGWLRTATTMVPQNGSAAHRQVTEVHPDDLAAALAADKES